MLSNGIEIYRDTTFKTLEKSTSSLTWMFRKEPLYLPPMKEVLFAIQLKDAWKYEDTYVSAQYCIVNAMTEDSETVQFPNEVQKAYFIHTDDEKDMFLMCHISNIFTPVCIGYQGTSAKDVNTSMTSYGAWQGTNTDITSRTIYKGPITGIKFYRVGYHGVTGYRIDQIPFDGVKCACAIYGIPY